ncbi:unnamed protein product [Lactuca virosa]|uniref:Uncharacterized protein n=1 Tax=Lactuca virosa TaxID=75947 RepID=A0AAU9MWJ6_9ASTR|nr:unnamed protein product [Lactuca virosa]
MSSSTPNPDGLYPIVDLNFKGVFLRNPFSYNHGINFTFNDHDFSGMTYGECITFLERFMQESIKKLYYCEPNGKICMYVDHDGQGIEDWFGSDVEEEDEDDSCIDGDISYMNRDVESYVDKMFSNITYMKAYKFRLATMNGSNLWPATDYTPPLPPVHRTMSGRPAAKRKRDATENPNQSSKKSKKTTQTQNKVNEGDEGNAMNAGNQGNAMNEGDEVNEGDQAVNDDGGAVNDGGEADSEVHVQQHYDEVELTPLEFDASGNGEPSQVHV